MTPEQINIAIAEHLGFLRTVTRWQFPLESPDGRIEDCRPYKSEKEAIEAGIWMEDHELGKAHPPKSYERIFTPPNYHADLNAMHEAEKVEFFTKGVPASRWENYDNHLHDVTGGFGRAHATAAQRCEAFLRAVGKFTE